MTAVPSIYKEVNVNSSLPAIRTTELTVHRATYVNLIKTNRETDLLCIFAHIFFGLLHDHYVQKLSGTRMATVQSLATFSSWLSVDQLHIPEEQVSW